MPRSYRIGELKYNGALQPKKRRIIQTVVAVTWSAQISFPEAATRYSQPRPTTLSCARSDLAENTAESRGVNSKIGISFSKKRKGILI